MPSTDRIVLIVDDDVALRETVSRVVRDFGFTVRSFDSADEFLHAELPDALACLLLDVMLGTSTGFDVVAELSRRNVDLPTIFMTGEGDIPMTVRAMKGGAVEFLTKPVDRGALQTAIDQAFRRAAEMRERRTELRSLEARMAKLTAREHDVLPLVVAGRLNKEIATELGVVEQTVKLHRAHIMEKLGVSSVAELVHMVNRLTVLRS